MIAKQLFGRTGHESTRAIFGAAALSKVTQAEADRTLDVLLQYGINHIDTAASYGESELRIGPWMDRHRKDFFLASKTGDRTYEKARESVHRSLERLRVSQIDLLQLHCPPTEVYYMPEVFGSLDEMVRAGKLRHYGVSVEKVEEALKVPA